MAIDAPTIRDGSIDKPCMCGVVPTMGDDVTDTSHSPCGVASSSIGISQYN